MRISDWSSDVCSSDLCTHCLERDVPGLERLRSDSLTLVDQAAEDVLGSDVVVGEHACPFLGKHDHPAGSVGEPFEHVQHSSTKGTTAPGRWDADIGTNVWFRSEEHPSELQSLM